MHYYYCFIVNILTLDIRDTLFSLDIPHMDQVGPLKNTAATPTSMAGSDTKSKRRGSVRKSGVSRVLNIVRLLVFIGINYITTYKDFAILQ